MKQKLGDEEVELKKQQAIRAEKEARKKAEEAAKAKKRSSFFGFGSGGNKKGEEDVDEAALYDEQDEVSLKLSPSMSSKIT